MYGLNDAWWQANLQAVETANLVVKIQTLAVEEAALAVRFADLIADRVRQEQTMTQTLVAAVDAKLAAYSAVCSPVLTLPDILRIPIV